MGGGGGGGGWRGDTTCPFTWSGDHGCYWNLEGKMVVLVLLDGGNPKRTMAIIRFRRQCGAPYFWIESTPFIQLILIGVKMSVAIVRFMRQGGAPCNTGWG